MLDSGDRLLIGLTSSVRWWSTGRVAQSVEESVVSPPTGPAEALAGAIMSGVRSTQAVVALTMSFYMLMCSRLVLTLESLTLEQGMTWAFADRTDGRAKILSTENWSFDLGSCG